MKDFNQLKCPISNSKKFKKIFSLKKFPIYMGVEKKKHKSELKDMNYYVNKDTGTVQIYPRVPLKKLYYKSHGSGKIGKTWQKHHLSFFNFFKNNLKGQIVEVGGGHNSLTDNFKNFKISKNCKIISFEPNPSKKKFNNHKIIKNFFDNKSVNSSKMNNCDLVVHSHLFEHIYNPLGFLKLVKKILKKNGYHIFSVPNIKKMILNKQCNAMNFEHPYFLEEDLVDELLRSLNFKILKKFYYKDHSIFYKTKSELGKKGHVNYNNFKKNLILFKNYKKNIDKDIFEINKKIKNKNFFLFGAHIFSQNLIFNKLKIKNLIGILDNDKDKVSQYLYATKFQVFNPQVIKSYNEPIIVVRTGSYNPEIINQLKKINKSSIIL